jgi:hypothetical protein
MLTRTQLQHTPGATVDLDPWLGVPGNEPTYSGGGVNSGMGTLVVGANRWLDFGLVVVPTRIKTLVVVISAALTSGAAQQATIQLFAARSIFASGGLTPQPNSAGAQASAPFAPVASAAASQFPTNPSTNLNAGQFRGAPTNLGASSASLGPAVFFFTPVDIPDLQWEFPVVGAEITAPAAFTGGTITVFLEVANV